MYKRKLYHRILLIAIVGKYGFQDGAPYPRIKSKVNREISNKLPGGIIFIWVPTINSEYDLKDSMVPGNICVRGPDILSN